MAYHGVGFGQSSDKVKNIIGIIYNGSFKKGDRQAYKNDKDRFHKGKKVGCGVYCTPFIDTAKEYAGQININGKIYQTVLMVRVKPNAIRSPENRHDYWVVEGTTDEIRPYRILYKKLDK